MAYSPAWGITALRELMLAGSAGMIFFTMTDLHGDDTHGDATKSSDNNALTLLREVFLLAPPAKEAGGVIRSQEHEL